MAPSEVKVKSSKELAADIDEYVNITAALTLISNKIGADVNASPLYNFRDALSHYVNFCESDDVEGKISQATSIDEHLFRGMKDAVVGLIVVIKGRIVDLYNISLAEKLTMKNDLRKIMHSYKELELSMRKNSETSTIRNLGVFIDKLHSLYEETEVCLKKYGKSHILKK